MIRIVDKHNCCGCGACVQICPHRCIALHDDNEGFPYPDVDTARCVDCGACEKVCPVICRMPSCKLIDIYAAKNSNDTVRYAGSSGGIFTMLAEQVIEQGGVVFGAEFDTHMQVEHGYTETKQGLARFRGSKYVQSRTGDAFIRVRQFVESGRRVLFSGTPCQVAGLKRFLSQDYSNLLTVDFVCHGVPSPMVWARCKEQLTDGDLISVNFRDKQQGWKNYGFSALTDTHQGVVPLFISHRKMAYMKGFLQALYLRPSCHRCPVKSLKSGSDLTLGDFWSIRRELPEFDDDKGVSLVVVNSQRGKKSYESLFCRSADVSAFALPSRLFRSVKPHAKRKLFFERVGQTDSVSSLIEELTFETPLKRFFSNCIHEISELITKFMEPWERGE